MGEHRRDEAANNLVDAALFDDALFYEAANTIGGSRGSKIPQSKAEPKAPGNLENATAWGLKTGFTGFL